MPLQRVHCVHSSAGAIALPGCELASESQLYAAPYRHRIEATYSLHRSAKHFQTAFRRSHWPRGSQHRVHCSIVVPLMRLGYVATADT